MRSNRKVASGIRWVARIWGALSIIFLLFMIGAHLFGTEDSLLNGFNSIQELIAFLLFPISTIVGLVIAYKFEGAGGLITIIGIISFHLLMQEYELIKWIDGLAFPGLLYLICWLLPKKKNSVISI